MLPVRTDKAIPKRLLFKVIEQLADIELQAPIKMYDVILKNTAGTGANIVATRNMKRTATTRDIVQPDRWHLRENQKAKIKMQNDRAKFKNVVRGFSLVHDPEKGRTTAKFPLPWRERSKVRVPLVIASPFKLSLRPFYLSLRAEGVAISVGQGIAEPVPRKARNLALRGL